MNGEERDLLAGITRRLEQNSILLHELSREQAVLRQAATQLRTGRAAGVVESQVTAAGVELHVRA